MLAALPEGGYTAEPGPSWEHHRADRCGSSCLTPGQSQGCCTRHCGPVRRQAHRILRPVLTERHLCAGLCAIAGALTLLPHGPGEGSLVPGRRPQLWVAQGPGGPGEGTTPGRGPKASWKERCLNGKRGLREGMWRLAGQRPAACSLSAGRAAARGSWPARPSVPLACRGSVPSSPTDPRHQMAGGVTSTLTPDHAYATSHQHSTSCHIS